VRRREMVARRWIGRRVLRSRGRAASPSNETVTGDQRSTIRAMSGSADHPKGRIGCTVAVGKQLDDLLPGQSLLVEDVGVDDYAIRVRYEVRPPIFERPTSVATHLGR
jgi:4'-phosphopantetheinyl transferase EntD